MILTHDRAIVIGHYSLILHKGGEFSSSGESQLFSGDFTYSSGKDSYSGQGVKFSSEGIYSFSIEINAPGAFGIGLCYYIDRWDARLERRIIKELASDVFLWDEAVTLDVSFSPTHTEDTKMVLQKDTMVTTCFQTIYGKQVALSLKAGFMFRLVAGMDIQGYPQYYFAPEGESSVELSGHLRLGLSGTEHISMNAGDIVCFHAGHPAYIGGAEVGFSPSTSFLSFPDSGYRTQPQEAGYYTVDKMIYHAAVLPAISVPKVIFPVLPYNRLRCGEEYAELVENSHLAPKRRKKIEGSLVLKKSSNGAEVVAVAGNGMKISLRGEELRWIRVAATEADGPGMAFCNLTPAFLLGLLANNLFLVLPYLNMRANTPYWLDEARLDEAVRNGYEETEKLKSLKDTYYMNSTELETAVKQAGASYSALLSNACDTFRLRIAGWLFVLSPELWESNQSLFVVKMDTHNSLTQQMDTPEKFSFSLPDEEKQTVKERFSDILSKAKKQEDAYLSRILNDKKWQGCVTFQAGVNINSLPDELGFLVNGINAEKIKALYVAFDSQKIKDGYIAPANCLIAYEDDEMLHFEDYKEFAFKVRYLRLKIENGKISDCKIKVELLVNRLLGSQVTGASGMYGNSLLFDGSLQTDEKGSYYAFVLEKPQTYYLSDSMIETLTIAGATLHAEGNNCRFQFEGNMKFAGQEQMDLLSYDSVGYKGIEVLMESKDAEYEFKASLTNFHFVTEEVQCRENSFAAGFPTVIGELKIAEGLDFLKNYKSLKLSDTVEQEELGTDWHGITWHCSMGNLGGLAASMKFELNILTAWNEKKELYCGITISSAVSGLRWSLPLQGIMELGFSRIELHKKEKKEEEGKTEWYFRFRDFSLSIMGKRFPETSNNLYLISDAEKHLGFYGVMEE